MQKALLVKLVVLSVVFGVLFSAVTATHGLVMDRSARRREAVAAVASSVGGEQLITGPVLVIPYSRIWPTMLERRELRLLPKRVTIEARVKPERRALGLFETTVAVSSHVIRGQFVLPHPLVTHEAAQGVHLEAPRFVVGVSDSRGIRSPPKVRWGSSEREVEPGAAGLQQNGFMVRLAQEDAPAGAAVDFEVQLEVAGTESVRWTPSGDEVEVNVHSSWPHPNFTGSYLPQSRSISNAGFSAKWAVNRFATGLELAADERSGQTDLGSLNRLAFGVALVNPVDVYSMSERATKYGFLFLTLTFGAFFLFELLARLRLHPMQYGLVGLAQALFFVLLLALAEHVRFLLAYWVAALATVFIITAYARSALGRWARAAPFGLGLAGLYGMMNVLLFSEDHALLLGAGMLFVLTALVMFLTRRVNWYGLEVELPVKDAEGTP